MDKNGVLMVKYGVLLICRVIMENIRYRLEVALQNVKQGLFSIAGESIARLTQLRSYRSGSVSADNTTSGKQPPSHDQSGHLPPT
jgi:hypothetical protein